MLFSNIEVNYSNDMMSLHVMFYLQCPINAGGIAALNIIIININIIIIIMTGARSTPLVTSSRSSRLLRRPATLSTAR